MSPLARQFFSMILMLAAACAPWDTRSASADGRQFTDQERELLRQVRTIRLVLSTTTWLNDPDWSYLNPRYEFPHRLREVGLTVVPDSATEFDAALRAAYVEEKGPGYGFMGLTGGISGTRISCAVELTHPKIGRILAFKINGETPNRVPWPSDLRFFAIMSFRRDTGFLLFGPRIAGALGVQNMFPDVASRLVEMLRSSAEEDRSSGAAALGELRDPATVIPLSGLLTIPQPPHVIRSAADALARIGDSNALPALRRLADETADPDIRRSVREAIESLERR